MTRAGLAPSPLTYEQAVARYCEAMAWRDWVSQPSRRLSYRNDSDSGWVLNNVHGYMAFVPDRGGVLSW
jgi:hypothetical protein